MCAKARICSPGGSTTHPREALGNPASSLSLNDCICKMGIIIAISEGFSEDSGRQNT